MATRTWNAAAGQTDMNNGSNYSPTGAIQTSDDLVFNNTSVVNATASANLSVATITVASNYSGIWTVTSRTISCSGNLTFAKAPIATNTTWNITGTNPTLTFGGTTSVSIGSVIFTSGAFIVGPNTSGSLTFTRFKTAPGCTYTFTPISTLNYALGVGTAGDYSGTAGSLVTFSSATPGTRYTISPSANITSSYMSVSDCLVNSSTVQLDLSDGTSVRGLNNKDIKWPTDIFYYDPSMVNDSGNGLSMSTAKKLRQSAYDMLSNVGDMILCRRNTTETPTATLLYPAFANGTSSIPMQIMGFPRNSLSFTGTWVNNVNAIWGLSITADVEQHIGRLVKNNTNGNNYLITDIIQVINWDGKANGGLVAGTVYTGQTSGYAWTCLYNIDNGSTGTAIMWKWVPANGRALFVDNDNLRVGTTTYAVVNGTPALCFCIDRPYIGTNATGAAGTIAKDEDYDWAQTLTTGQGADLLSTWNSDAHDLPILDWNAGAFSDQMTRPKYEYKYLCYKNSNATVGSLTNNGQNIGPAKLFGCYFSQNQAKANIVGSFLIDRCIFDAVASGATIGINTIAYNCIVRNSAIHHVNNALSTNAAIASPIKLDNVNLGVERESTTSEIVATIPLSNCEFKDVSIGTSSTLYLARTTTLLGNVPSKISIENMNKVANAHKIYVLDIGTITKNDCSGEPVSRTGGALSVVEFLANIGTYSTQTKAPVGYSSAEWCPSYIEMKVWLSATDIVAAKNFKFYVQSVTDTLTSSDLWLECEYIIASTAQGYLKTIVTSSESITARSSASDWSQFISTGNITVAAASWVTLRIFCNKYSANKRYVDPKYEGCLREPLWSLGQPVLSLENTGGLMRELSFNGGFQ